MDNLVSRGLFWNFGEPIEKRTTRSEAWSKPNEQGYQPSGAMLRKTERRLMVAPIHEQLDSSQSAIDLLLMDLPFFTPRLCWGFWIQGTKERCMCEERIKKLKSVCTLMLTYRKRLA